MAYLRGEPYSREIVKRIGTRLANTTALAAVNADDPSRADGCITSLDDQSMWRFDVDSTLAASDTVVVPSSGNGRWIRVVAAGGAADSATWKPAVRLATAGALGAYTRTGNVITANANGAIGNIDGVAPAVGNRILVTSAGSAADADNGVYDVTALGGASAKYVLTRSQDSNTSAAMQPGFIVYVSEGTTLGNTFQYCTANATITLNTTAITLDTLPSGTTFTSLETRVSTEESTRSDADASLTTRVSTEESTRSDADASLTTRVSTEESTRSDADASLTTRVSTEESTRSDEVASLETSLETRVSTEESTRSDADASLTTRVSTEESTRSDADASLTTRVSTEESTRSDADASLTTRVSTEESTRSDEVASLETSLETRVSTEESTRSDADASLTTRISTEESVRSDADASIVTRITQERTATFTSADLVAAGLTQSLNVGAAIPATAMILGYRMNLTDAFDSPGAGSLDVQLGDDSVDDDSLCGAFDAYTGSTNEGAGWTQGTRGAQPDGPPSGTQLSALFTATVDNLNTFTNGSLQIDVLYIDYP